MLAPGNNNRRHFILETYRVWNQLSLIPLAVRRERGQARASFDNLLLHLHASGLFFKHVHFSPKVPPIREGR